MTVHLARAVATTLAATFVLVAGPVGASPVIVHTQGRQMGAGAGVAGGAGELAVRFSGLPAGNEVVFRFDQHERTGTTDATGLAQVSVPLPEAPGTVTWTARFAGTQSSSSVSYAPSEHTREFRVTGQALRLSLPAQVRSGAASDVTVTAVAADGAADLAASGTPTLTATDTHASPASCGSYQDGVARCSGLVLRDLGRQVLTAVDGAGRGGAEGGVVTVAPAGVSLIAYERATAVGSPAEFLVEPLAATAGLHDGYLAVSEVRASTGEQASAPCAGSGCRIRLTFTTPGPRDVVGVEGQGGLVSEPVRVDVGPRQAHGDCESGARISLDRSAIVAGASAGVAVREVPGTLVDLYAYTQPSTAYRLVRSATTDSAGIARFSVRPPANTRLLARQREEDCGHAVSTAPSVVLAVHTGLTLGVAREGVRSYVFAGDSMPARPGGLVVSLYRIRPDGRQVLTGQARASQATGQWSLRRTFSGTGRFGFVARTGRDMLNAPGASVVRTTLIR